MAVEPLLAIFFILYCLFFMTIWSWCTWVEEHEVSVGFDWLAAEFVVN